MLLTIANFVQGQFKTLRLDSAGIPKNIRYTGKLKDALWWEDKLGDNITIITETGKYRDPKIKHETEGSDAEVFAYNYSLADSVKQTWKVYDFIHDCDLDMEAGFIKNTLNVTDLDNDGIAEVWLMYKTVCHGDVSPAEMKIIMYKGQQKFAMRGQNKVQLSKTESYGGAYIFDKAFTDGPKAFRVYAEKLWNKNILQVW